MKILLSLCCTFVLASCGYSPESKIIGVWESIPNKEGASSRFYFNKDKKTGHFWLLDNRKLYGVINFTYSFYNDYRNMKMEFVSSNPRTSDFNKYQYFNKYEIVIHHFTDNELKFSFKKNNEMYDLKRIVE